MKTLFHIYMYVYYIFVTHTHTQWWGNGLCFQRAQRGIKYLIIIQILYIVFIISCMKVHILFLCICLVFPVFFQGMNGCCWRCCAFAHLILYLHLCFNQNMFLRGLIITSVHTCFSVHHLFHMIVEKCNKISNCYFTASVPRWQYWIVSWQKGPLWFILEYLTVQLCM